MSDNFKRYNRIKSGLRQLLPGTLGPRQLQPLDHLARLVNGIVAAGHTQLPKLAAKDPRPLKTESKIASLKRLVATESFSQELFFVPFVKAFLAGLARSRKEVVLVIDGSTVGRGCMALVVSVVYAGRALPIAWLVVEGKKGHLAQERHLQLLQQVQSLLSEGQKVVLLGDGEFDGTLLQEAARQYGWQWVVRTAKSSLYRTPRSRRWGKFGDWKLARGGFVAHYKLGFSGEGWGPVTGIGVWEKEYEAPLYLVTSFTNARLAAAYYKKRYRIETFFSDQKSRGFRLDQSHLDQPDRLARLMIGCVYAYWWLVYLGTYAREHDWDSVVHRTSRCDLSFFQLGWRLLEHWLNIDYQFELASNSQLSFFSKFCTVVNK